MESLTPEWHERIARLEAEKAALEDQVLLLVRTEQRLYRSSNALDAQFVLIRSLADLAISGSLADAPWDIVQRGLGIVGRGFALDWAGVVRVGTVGGTVEVLAQHESTAARLGPIAVDAEIAAWLARIEEPHYVERSPTRPDPPVLRLAQTIVPDIASAANGHRVAWVPIRDVGGGERGGYLAFSIRRRPQFLQDGAFGHEHLPFLALLAKHVDHSVANSVLTSSLRERSRELAESLDQLGATQKALLHAQKMEAIGQLAGGVAHDFNNLLTVILGYASSLNVSLPAGTPGHQHVRRILDAAGRASGITSQLLALGRRQIQQPEVLDLGEHATQTLDLLRRVVGEHIRLEFEFGAGLPRVRVDRTHLEQVLLNLVLNARDAMPAGGTMRIRTRRPTAADAIRCAETIDTDAFIALDVEDDGIGMDEVTRSRVFEPFFTTKPAEQGTGLGLSVVYGIVQQSRGQILVSSAPGTGTCFTVLFPAALFAATPDQPRAPDVPALASAVASATILVVEDEAAIRDVVHETLARAGHVVHEAENGEHALRRLAEGEISPDLVLTDVMMPRLGGLRLAEEVCARYPGVTVAFMSGYADELFGKAMDGRRNAFLAKPFTPTQLTAFIRTLIEDRTPRER